MYLEVGFISGESWPSCGPDKQFQIIFITAHDIIFYCTIYEKPEGKRESKITRLGW